MSNFYDLETDLEVEDIQRVNTDDDDDFEDISEFAAFDEEDAKSRWGSLDFEELVHEMEDYVAKGKKFFFSKKKRIVNGEDIDHLVKYILQRFPDDFAQARDIIKTKTDIIDNARREEANIVASAKDYYKTTTQRANADAEKIISRAQEQAEEMVASHSITQAARVKADEIKDACQKDVNAMYAKAKADCEAHKQFAREWAVNTTQGSYNFVCEALSKYQKVAMNNLNQISEVYKQFQNGFENQMNSLQANESVQPSEE